MSGQLHLLNFSVIKQPQYHIPNLRFSFNLTIFRLCGWCRIIRLLLHFFRTVGNLVCIDHPILVCSRFDSSHYAAQTTLSCLKTLDVSRRPRSVKCVNPKKQRISSTIKMKESVSVCVCLSATLRNLQ